MRGVKYMFDYLICPTCVGVNRIYTPLHLALLAICPTCVGVNRMIALFITFLLLHLPHMRGGEPITR